ncbi:MAG: PP2C family protein-serine/threonine phosphatase [Myxococcota bacterium]
MRQFGTPSSLPWSQALILVSPSVGLLAAAVLLEPNSATGFALMLAAVSYLFLNLVVIQPWLTRQRRARYAVLPELTTWFAQKLGACTTPDEVAGLLGRANQLITGHPRAVLVVGERVGALALYGGQPGDRDALSMAGDSAEWLLSQRGITLRSELDRRSGPAMLLDRLHCQVAMPLRDGSTVLGLALVRVDLRQIDMATVQVYRWLCSATSIALARLGLGFDMNEALQIVGIVDYARATQQALMPDDRLIESEGFRLRGISRPAAQCGGDLWAWRSLGEGRILVVIGDVTGHGVVQAVLSATAAGAVHANAFAWGPHLDPAALLSDLNRSFYRVAQASYMMTAFAAIADFRAGELRYANAGQNFPYLISPASNPEDKASMKPLVARGPMLGAGPEISLVSHRHPIAPGEKLFMYTDGITEAQIAKNKSFGERRLRRKLQATANSGADAIATAVLDSLDQFLMGRPTDDDVTIVVVERPHGRRR